MGLVDGIIFEKFLPGIRIMRKRLRFYVAVAMGGGMLCFPSFLPAMEITPFYTQNQSPVIQIFGLPSIGDPSVVPARKTDLRFIVDLANNFIQDEAPRESIILDGQSTRLSLDGRYGISRNFEVGLVIPYLIEGGGFTDGFIDWYHNTFGFTQGGRENAPRNRLLYKYQKDQRVLLQVDQSSHGIGDIQLTGGYQLFQSAIEPSRALSLRTSLKLPTGDSQQLHGSGSTDLSLWMTGGETFRPGIGPITLFGAGGVMGMTEGDVLEDQQRNWVGFAVLGAGWSPARWIAFKIQANGHTSFYKESELQELNRNSVQLTVGGTLAFSKNISLDLGVTEDLLDRASPDVVFHLALRGTF
jgi:hypothetical protein